MPITKKQLYVIFDITSEFQMRECVFITVELRWLEPLWDHENLFETAVVRATEGYY